MAELTIGYARGRYRVYGPTYDAREELRQLGWKWDADAKVWSTSDPLVVEASPFEMYPDAQDRLEADLVRLAQSERLSRARSVEEADVDIDAEVPVPEGQALLPFQRAGTAWPSSCPEDRP